MDTKTILTGLSGIIIGGLIVSVAATTQNTNSRMHQASNLSANKGDDFDKAFMSEMIVHHQGAIDMAKYAATNAKHDEVKKLSNDILAAQSREIDMMQTWQGEWGYKAVPSIQSDHMTH